MYHNADFCTVVLSTPIFSSFLPVFSFHIQWSKRNQQGTTILGGGNTQSFFLLAGIGTEHIILERLLIYKAFDSIFTQMVHLLIVVASSKLRA